MKSFLCIVVYLLLAAHPLVGQSFNENEFAAKINRLNSRLSIANRAVKTPTSEFELSEEQKKQLIELRKRHQGAVKGYQAFAKDESEKARQFLFGEITEMENELTTEILLPHQLVVLNEQLFERQLIAHGGNLIQVMLAGYRDQLELDEGQVEKLQKLSDETKKQILEAKTRFEEEIKEIKSSAEKKLREQLSSEQLGVLSSVQGEKK